MRFGSVCSGIEAASVAFAPLGWEAAWFSEIEAFPSAVLAHHFPNVPNHGDMTTLRDRIIANEIEAPEMLCGGTPCQAFSVAGQRKSLDDERGNLSLTFCEIADAIDTTRSVRGERASIILWENVPGVLNTKDNAFGCFLGQLAGSGIQLTPHDGGTKWSNAGVVIGPKRKVAWRILDAQFFGVPQRRKRVFVIASARDDFDPCAVLFERPRMSGDSEQSGEARQSTSPDSEECARGASQGVSLGSEKAITPTLVAGYSKCYNALKDGGHLAVHTGFREGSFGQFVETEQGGTARASGGPLGGGSETLLITEEEEKQSPNPQIVGTLTACDLMKGSTNNQLLVGC